MNEIKVRFGGDGLPMRELGSERDKEDVMRRIMGMLEMKSKSTVENKVCGRGKFVCDEQEMALWWQATQVWHKCCSHLQGALCGVRRLGGLLTSHSNLYMQRCVHVLES